MNLIRTIDRNVGSALRWLVGQMTGNILAHMEKRLIRRIQGVEDSILPALESVNRLRDDLERLNLEMYKKANHE